MADDKTTTPEQMLEAAQNESYELSDEDLETVQDQMNNQQNNQ